ncbi:protein MON2 homolog isoform X2 [Mizuhopecten yessoensis]|uniref:protein MON2 homolog isoform X2 n=1 Tax=Mizuhopecten yessoensis TaxID=6573 RepID=UPI000B45A697|nr:protein MON2 homolog isoform X2 [Mizuhopecten yessoensis]
MMPGQPNTSLGKKLLDNLQTDLRTLSSESRRKHPNVKEASEQVQLRLRTISAKSEDIISGLLPASAEIVHPFVLGCETKNSKIIQLCLMTVQRLISHEALSMTAANNVIQMLWQLMEAGTEELKLLQTAILLITTNLVVQHESLAKALVLCFRLHFTKDSTTINTAAAIIKQLVSNVFERVIVEDRVQSQEQRSPLNTEELKVGSRNAPKSLRPCAGDAYLLFQDLCQLVNADQPFWLVGMTEMTRTFGLELLEAVLTSFPTIFLQHPEFSFLLKERVCPLVIKLFSPSLKYRQGLPSPPSPAPVEKPYFPIVMRLLRIVSALIKHFYKLLMTECEIFLSLLVKFLEPEKPMWQRCLSLEVLHKLSMQPDLVRSFCQSYDMKQHSTKIFRDMVNGLGAFIQSQFMNPMTSQTGQTGLKPPDTQGTPPAILGGLPVGGGVTPQPAFMYRGTWIPLVNIGGQARSMYLEMLDKLDPPNIVDGYGLSLAFHCLVEVVKSVQYLLQGDNDGKEDQKIEERKTSQQQVLTDEERGLHEELINSSWCGMLAAMSLLLDASTDESATQAILKSLQTFANLCGVLQMNIPRDAFITALCKASLPPHYTLTILNSQSNAQAAQRGHYRSISQDLPTMGLEAVERSQVVAVGTPLPTASLPAGAHTGPVMLTAKNIQCMRALLAVAHCHGGILGTAWHLVLTTLQHLVWILGLKPSSGGSLRFSQQISEGSNAVITTAVMADLPVLSAMLSRLFESSQYLDDVALHHLIDALCKLSSEAMELAYSNREPSLFAVAKLLETGLVNLARVEVLWRPVTAHLLEVCQHPHQGMRCWGAEAVTSLVRAALEHGYDPPLQTNLKLQMTILSPLQELSNILQSDIRQRQLECVLQILHNNGDTLLHGWPLMLGVIGAVNNNQGEKLIQTAFQSLQLVVTDFLPIIPCMYLQVCVEVAAKFGLQNQELNISLTAIGLLWNVADFFYQNRQRINTDLDKDMTDAEKKKLGMPAFDALWMCLFMKLGQLCVDERPAVRKSAGQTLFSTISAHGGLLHKETWKRVLWQVLFPLLEKVQKLSSTASNVKDEAATGNILIHHSRDTAEKQWAETRVLTLAGVARTFNSKRKTLQTIAGDFPRAWSLLLEYIEYSALCLNAEVSLAALKSFQEILQINRDPKDKGEGSVMDGLPSMAPPLDEVMNRSEQTKGHEGEGQVSVSSDMDYDPSLWATAWKVWLNIGTNATKPPETTHRSEKVYVPSQPFLTALIQTFPSLFEHIKTRFVGADLQKLCTVLKSALTVPVHGDASPFIIPSYPDVTITPLQEATLQSMEALIQAIHNGPESMQSMYPDIFHQLLTFIEYGVRVPKYGQLDARAFGSVKGPQVDWVTMNFVPFAEKSVELAVDLYRSTAKHPAVVDSQILQHIIKTFRLPLGYKYNCPSPTTWTLVIHSLLTILNVGLSVARKHETAFQSMWPELAHTLEEFLFSKSTSPPTMSVEDFQRDEAIDCKVIQMIRDDILPYAGTMPKDFVKRVMKLLNRGSIHSTTSDNFIDTDSSRKLREEFAKTCFETLLQFSFISQTKSEEGTITRLAVLSLLQRCQDVVRKYVEDEKLSGKCPLPRPRLAEMASVLKAITTLLVSLKKAPPGNVEVSVWKQVIQLYPYLVDCTTSSSPNVCRALKDALHQYRALLIPPISTTLNGTS